MNREINIKEFLISVLRGWRIIILIAFVCGILLGGIRFITGLRNLSNVMVESGSSATDKKIENLRKEISFIDEKIADIDLYINENELMQVNPLTDLQATVVLQVKSRDYEQSKTIAQVFKKWMNNNINQKEMVEQLEIDENISYLAEAKDDLFYIMFYGSGKVEVDQVISKMLAELELSKMTVYPSGENEYSLEKIEIQTGAELADMFGSGEGFMSASKLQKDIITTRSTYQDLRSRRSTELSTLVGEDAPLTTRTEVARNAIKMMILGIFFGAILGICISLMKELMTGKLRSAKEFDEFGIRVVSDGAFFIIKKRNPIDHVIDNLAGIEYSLVSEEKKRGYLKESLELFIRNQKLSETVYLVSSLPQKAIQPYINELDSIDLDKNRVSYIGNVNRDKEALMALREEGVIILIEKVNHSLLSNIDREISYLNSCDKKIDGCLVV